MNPSTPPTAFVCNHCRALVAPTADAKAFHFRRCARLRAELQRLAEPVTELRADPAHEGQR